MDSSQASVEPQCRCLPGLGALPQELMIRVLRAASIPPAELVRLLPSSLHTAAVHAAFPSIESEGSVYVHTSDLECAPFAEALWPAISQVTSFRAYAQQVYGPDAMLPEAATALGSHLVKLSCIQELDLSCSGIHAEGSKSLGPYLAYCTSIQHLHLSLNQIGDDGTKSLGPHLAKWTSLQRLLLWDNEIGADGAISLGLIWPS